MGAPSAPMDMAVINTRPYMVQDPLAKWRQESPSQKMVNTGRLSVKGNLRNLRGLVGLVRVYRWTHPVIATRRRRKSQPAARSQVPASNTAARRCNQ